MGIHLRYIGIVAVLPAAVFIAISQASAKPPAGTDARQGLPTQPAQDNVPAAQHQHVKIVFEPPKVIIRTPSDAKRLSTAANAVSNRLTKRSKGVTDSEIESMGTVTVQGHKLKPICILSFLKTALHNDYSRDPADTGKMVCRYVHLLSSRARTYLKCEINADRTVRYRTAMIKGGYTRNRTIKMAQKLPIVDPAKLNAAMAVVTTSTSMQCSG